MEKFISIEPDGDSKNSFYDPSGYIYHFTNYTYIGHYII